VTVAYPRSSIPRGALQSWIHVNQTEKGKNVYGLNPHTCYGLNVLWVSGAMASGSVTTVLLPSIRMIDWFEGSASSCAEKGRHRTPVAIFDENGCGPLPLLAILASRRPDYKSQKDQLSRLCVFTIPPSLRPE
jgi:hypothetical protein